MSAASESPAVQNYVPGVYRDCFEQVWRFDGENWERLSPDDGVALEFGISAFEPMVQLVPEPARKARTHEELLAEADEWLSATMPLASHLGRHPDDQATGEHIIRHVTAVTEDMDLADAVLCRLVVTDGDMVNRLHALGAL